LRADPVQRVLHEPEHRGPDERTRGHQHVHLRYPQKRRDELCRESGTQYDPEIPEDMLYF